MNSECPLCEKTLRWGAKSCSCGWKHESAEKAQKIREVSCSYETLGNRCQFPASIGTRCRFHHSCDPHEGAQFVADSRKWADAISSGGFVEPWLTRADGTREANYLPLNQREAITEKRALKAYREAGLERREGETEQAHRNRVMAHLRVGMQKVARAA